MTNEFNFEDVIFKAGIPPTHKWIKIYKNKVVEDVSTYVERAMYVPTSLGAVFVEFRPEKNVFPAIQIREIPVYQREASP